MTFVDKIAIKLIYLWYTFGLKLMTFIQTADIFPRELYKHSSEMEKYH